MKTNENKKRKEIIQEHPSIKNLVVSNNGDVYFKGVMLNQTNTGSISGNHYKKVCITPRPGEHMILSVHRLVAETFIGEIPKGYIVHHKNDVACDNRVENLEITTQSKNIQYSYRNRETRNPLSNKERFKIFLLKEGGLSIKEIATLLSRSYSTIYSCLHKTYNKDILEKVNNYKFNENEKLF